MFYIYYGICGYLATTYSTVLSLLYSYALMVIVLVFFIMTIAVVFGVILGTICLHVLLSCGISGLYLLLLREELLFFIDFEHHSGRHEVMFEDLFGMNAFTRMHVHDLLKQVNEVGVTYPLITVIVISFLQGLHEWAYAMAEQSVLLGHDLSIVTACNTEQTHINSAVAIKRKHSTLQ